MPGLPNIKRLVQAFAVETASSHYRATRGTPAPKDYLVRVRKFVGDLLANPKAYHRYEIVNGEVASLVIAWQQPQPVGPATIMVHPWIVPPAQRTAAAVAAEIAAMRRHFGKRPALYVGLFADQEPLRTVFTQAGFRLDSYELVGRVSDGLRYTSKRLGAIDRRDYVLEPMDFKRDVNAVLRLDHIAHADNPTSRAHGRNRSIDRVAMRDFFQQATTPPNQTLLLYRQDAGSKRRELAGVVGVTFNQRQRASALLGTITIHPRHQGKGLANWLYHSALTLMAERGVAWYHGFSSTDRVLHHAKNMGRVPTHVMLTDQPKGR